VPILRELINGEKLSEEERRMLGVKIIEFYERKIEREDYSSVTTENLLVSNFIHRKP
jgi:hypothetical protein